MGFASLPLRRTPQPRRVRRRAGLALRRQLVRLRHAEAEVVQDAADGEAVREGVVILHPRLSAWNPSVGVVERGCARTVVLGGTARSLAPLCGRARHEAARKLRPLPPDQGTRCSKTRSSLAGVGSYGHEAGSHYFTDGSTLGHSAQNFASHLVPNKLSAWRVS